MRFWHIERLSVSHMWNSFKICYCCFCKISCVICHVSGDTCHNFFFTYKVVKLVGGGSVINWATLSSLLYLYFSRIGNTATSTILLAILFIIQQYCWHCQWLCRNIAGNLFSNIADNIASNVASNFSINITGKQYFQ